MGEHFLKVPDARIVATEQLLDVRDLVGELVDVHAMGAVYGNAGTGKTFAVDKALEEHAQNKLVRHVFRSRPTTRYLRQELYTALGLGSSPPSNPTDTDRLLRAALAEQSRLVVIDEAQWLNRECFEYLRFLHDDPASQFALLFVGGQGCYEVLRHEPMLHSRLYAIARFQELSDPECCQVLPAFHPLYADVAPELIIHINRQCTLGNFREWTKFTYHALRYVERTEHHVLDEEVASNVFTRFALGRFATRMPAVRA